VDKHPGADGDAEPPVAPYLFSVPGVGLGGSPGNMAYDTTCPLRHGVDDDRIDKLIDRRLTSLLEYRLPKEENEQFWP
jgi:hypothetical protein